MMARARKRAPLIEPTGNHNCRLQTFDARLYGHNAATAVTAGLATPQFPQP
jgi:hypothetical protein